MWYLLVLTLFLAGDIQSMEFFKSLIGGTVQKSNPTESISPLSTVEHFLRHPSLLESGSPFCLDPDMDSMLGGEIIDSVPFKKWVIARQAPVLLKHEDFVSAYDFDKTGTYVVTGSGNTAKIWDSQTGELVRTFTHPARVGDVKFHKSGMHIITGAEDGIARIWVVSSGRLYRALDGKTSSIFQVAISNNGEWIATGSKDGVIGIWNWGMVECYRDIRGDISQPISGLQFSDDSNYLLIKAGEFGFTAGKAPLWNLNGAQVGGDRSFIESNCFSKDGSLIAIGTQSALVLIQNSAGHVVRAMRHDKMPGSEFWGAVNSVAFNKSGTELLTASGDQTVRIWDLKTGQARQFVGHKAIVKGAAFNAAETLVVSSSDDETIKIWRKAGDAQETPLLITFGTAGPARHVIFMPDDRRIIAVTGFDFLSKDTPDTVCIWHLDPLESLRGRISLKQALLLNHLYQIDQSNFLYGRYGNSKKVLDFKEYPHLKAIFSSFDLPLKRALRHLVINAEEDNCHIM